MGKTHGKITHAALVANFVVSVSVFRRVLQRPPPGDFEIREGGRDAVDRFANWLGLRMQPKSRA